MDQADTLSHRIQDARRRFERAGIEPAEAAIDADVLARHALGGWERGRLLAAARDPGPPGFAAAFEPLVRRREGREPTGYIIGRREFWELDLEVGPGVLIPRPETEFLVEETLARASERVDTGAPGGGGPAVSQPHFNIADVGTGSGCVAVALARWLPAATITAIDASDAALDVARRNAARHDVGDRVLVVKGDLLREAKGPYDAVVSNPPYVPTGQLDRLQPEIRLYEPVSALDGGPDGLDVIRRLVPQAAGRLRPGGWLLFEFGYGQAEDVRAIISAVPGLEFVDLRADLAGIPRVAVARRRVTDSENSVASRIPPASPEPAGRPSGEGGSPESRTSNPGP
jgi:release factor glutamine methyltransferase